MSRPIRAHAAQPMLSLESFIATAPSPLPVPSPVVAVPERTPALIVTRSPKVEPLPAAVVLPSPLAASTSAPIESATSKLEPLTAITPAPWTISTDATLQKQVVPLPIAGEPAITKPAVTIPSTPLEEPVTSVTPIAPLASPNVRLGVASTPTVPAQASLPALNAHKTLAKPVRPSTIAQPNKLRPTDTPVVTGAEKQGYPSIDSSRQSGVSESPDQLNPEQPIAVNKQLAESVIDNLRKEAPVTPGSSVHQVEPGDTLEEIAENYHVSVQELASTNRIANPNVILVGQALKMPSQAKVMPSYKIASLPETTPNVVSDVPTTVKVVAQATPTRNSKVTSATRAIAVADSYEPQQTAQTSRTAKEWQVASGAMTEQKSANTNSLTGSYVAIVKRTVLPQLARLELPPLAPADTYLPPLAGTGQYISPAKGILTSGYGRRWGRMHRGIDIAAPVGTPVVASAPGVVVASGWNSGGYGKLVKIRHLDGGLTLYAHNNKLLARAGQEVDRGQQIAEMGSTGRSTGPHVHFEIHPSGRGAVNPMTFLSRRN